jgi:serine/threonine protein phosphatase PrpC
MSAQQAALTDQDLLNEVRERSALSKQLRLDVAQLTDVGRKRPHNEDNMAYVIPKDAQVMAKKGALFVVADGMGGHAAGEVASEIAVETISSAYYQDDNEDITVSLLHAIKRANALIHQRAAENMMRSGMGTTCVAAVLRGSTAYIANIGDSRAYLVRAGQVRQVSQDHSWVEEQVRAGLLTRDQARSHAQRNVITRSLGTQSDVDVDIFTEQLFEGDTLLLCSDGLSGQVSDEDLRIIVGKYLPQECVYRLVELANENGGPDNITAIVIRVLEPGWDPYPVPVGSREAIAEAVTLGRVPSAPLAGSSKLEDAMTQPIPPARLKSGPLPANDGYSFSRPAFAPPARTKRPPLLWLAVATLAVLLLGLLGGGVYYFVRPMLFPTVDVDHTLSNAKVEITQAQKDLAAKDAPDALSALSTAQKELRSVQSGTTLSSSQTQSLHLLQNNLVTTTRTAITAYNQQELISFCNTNMTSSPVNSGNTNTQPTSIATVESGATVYRYAVGEDHNLYQLDTHLSLVNKQSLPGNPQVLMLAGAQDHVVALTSVAKGPNTSYSLNLLTPNASGGLDTKNTISLDTYMKSGLQPSLLTAWTTDAYIVLSSQTTPYSVTILNVPETNSKFGTAHPITISVSNQLVSFTAFPNHQLFLLDSAGNVQSLQFADNQQASNVVLQHPIANPLPISASSFSLNTSVPAPARQTSSSLTISPGSSQAIFLTTGLVNNVAHLYIVDSVYHRVIALQATSDQATSTANATPTAKATSAANATPTKQSAQQAASANNVVESNGQPGAVTTMTIVQQYVSSDVLTVVKAVSTNPKISQLFLLTANGQNAAGTNLVTVDVSQQNACAS